MKCWNHVYLPLISVFYVYKTFKNVVEKMYMVSSQDDLKFKIKFERWTTFYFYSGLLLVYNYVLEQVLPHMNAII